MNFNDVMRDAGAPTSNSEIEDLNKAITTGDYGYEGAPSDLTGGGALQYESLESSLKSVTFGIKHIKLWPTLYQGKANNTVEEYNRINKFGDQWNGFVSEGGLPRSTDADYSRHVYRIRYIGVTREVTHQHTLVRNAHGDAIGQQVENGVKHILEMTERGLFSGRSHYSNNGVFDGADSAIPDEDLGWYGVDAQIRQGQNDPKAKAAAFASYGFDEGVVSDLRGGILDEDALEDAARINGENFGYINQMFMDFKTHSDLSKQFYPKQRINQMGVSNGSAGYVLQNFVSSNGQFDLISDVFLRPKTRPSDALHTSPLLAPTGVVAVDPLSKFEASDAGSYVYYFTAIKEADVNTSGAGEGVASTASAPITVAAGEKVTLTLPGLSGAFAYAVYRSVVGGDASTAMFIGYVKSADLVGGATTFVDLNHKIPGAASAYMLENNSENIEFKKLLPLLKFDLARLAPVFRWCQLLYGAPIMFAPRKHFIFCNIGKSV